MAVKTERDCSAVDRLLSRRRGALDAAAKADAEAHLAHCERCRALLAAWEQQTPSSQQNAITPEMLRRLEEQVLNDLRPVRPLPPNLVFAVLYAAIFIVLVMFGVQRVGMFGWLALSGLQRLAIFTSLAASAALLSFSAVRLMVPGSRHLISPALLPPAIIAFLSLVVAAVIRFQSETQFIRTGMRCLQTGAPYALLALIPFVWLSSRGASVRPYLSGATTGLLAGLVGASVLEFFCPQLSMTHIIVWHLGVAVLGIAAGLLITFLGAQLSKIRIANAQTPRQRD